MKIEFEVNLDDCLSLNQHLLKTSPILKKTMRKGQISWLIWPVVGASILLAMRKMPFYLSIKVIGIVFAICLLPAIILFPIYFKWHNRNFVKKNCLSEKNKGILGKHIITITDEHFNEKTEFNDTSIPWKGIDRIEGTEEHTFIFVNDFTAFIVPKKPLSEESYNKFVQEIYEIFTKNK